MSIETKIKSHPGVTYLDTNNFYGLAVNSVYGSNLESVNLTKRLHTNNQQKCIDCLKPRSNKCERECKKYSCDCFYVPKFFIRSITHLVCIKMAVFSKIKSHSDTVDYFKELPFYNKPIKKPKVKRLKNIYQFTELLFHEQLSVIKTNHAFRGYAMSYKVEIIEKKDPVVQLEASKSSIKDLFSDLLNKLKGFKYQITVKL